MAGVMNQKLQANHVYVNGITIAIDIKETEEVSRGKSSVAKIINTIPYSIAPKLWL